MKRLIVGTLSVAVLIAIPRITTAQIKTVSSEVRVGDKVDIVWTEALLVSLEPGK